MFEDIQKHRQAVAENIEKSFQIGFTESEDLQKAHNVGDIHPNGKWVWTQLPSGKYDWRVIKKTTQGAGNAAPTTAKDSFSEKKNKENSEKSNVEKLPNGMEIRYKDIIEKVNGNVRGLHLKKKYYAELYQDGKRIDWQYAEPEAKSDFDNKIKEWRDKASQKNSAVDAKVKPSSKKNPSELKTISEVEDYAKSISGVAFKSVKSGWSDEGAKAFELTYSKGGKMVIDFLNGSEFIYRLTDNTGKVIIDTNSTDEIFSTDWSKQLNPSSVISKRIDWMKQRLVKLKGERRKAEKRHISHPSDFTDRYRYKQASEAVAEQEKKIKDWEGYISKF